MTFGQTSSATVAAAKRWIGVAIRRLSSSHLSLDNAGLMLVVISSGIFLIYFTLPADLINKKTILRNSVDTSTEYQTVYSIGEFTSELLLKEKRIVDESLKVCREEANHLLENEKENHRQTNATLTATLESCWNQKLQQTNQTNGHFKEEKNVTNMTVTMNREFFNYMAAYLQDTPYPGVENYSQYVITRLGLLPLNDVIQLIPDFGPVINDVLSFDYPITIPSCLNHSANHTIFVAVNSAPDNFDRRNAIRNTWPNDFKTENAKGSMGMVGFAFILGRTANNLTQSKIEEESQTYGDIIQIGMSDFYRNLSLKVAGMFNWLYKNCDKVDFVLKVDDDVYVNVRNLAHFLQHNQPSNQSMFGTSAGGYTTNRNGKWSISFEEWPWKQYPPYVFGPAVLIPGSTIVPLLAAMQTTPMMPFDDVYYTAICTEKAGIKIQFSSNTNCMLTMEQPVECALGRVVAWITKNQANSHLATNDFYNNTILNCTAS